MTKAQAKTKTDLQKQVEHIAKQIQTGEYDTENEDGCSAFDYLKDVLDINYIVESNRKTYKAARVLVTFGGPNIWIDTLHQRVEGYWWGEYAEARYTEDVLGLDDCLGELFSC